ncbi:MAG TPA: hypothetical protein VFQ63_01815 [Patescibacteria group bacterium]|nr:hypothetical protein [Patescibacteria group bacterium]
MNLSPQQISQFQQEILKWYKAHQRDLPWRRDRDAYHILISEVMLQQTQVGRVIPKYEAWLGRFPTIESLSQASVAEVLTYWSGLGYNRRAVFLQRFAKEVVEKYGGEIPQDKKTLKSLPGIGEYTALAILCFAYNHQVAVIDTNIRKVIATHFFEGVLPEEKIIERVAFKLLPKNKAYEWNQALMDYSSAVLKEKKIPIPKQSHFLTSNRYVRGTIMKFLVHHQIATQEDLEKEFAKGKVEVSLAKLQLNIDALCKEGMIIKKQKLFMLPQ